MCGRCTCSTRRPGRTSRSVPAAPAAAMSAAAQVPAASAAQVPAAARGPAAPAAASARPAPPAAEGARRGGAGARAPTAPRAGPLPPDRWPGPWLLPSLSLERLLKRRAELFDDLVVPLVGADQPVPLACDPHVGLGVRARGGQPRGAEHAHDRRVFLGEPAAGDLAAIKETLLVLHVPETPRLDGLPEFRVR